MIQKETVLNVCDNSGGIISQCIHLYAGNKQNSLGVGGLIRVTVKKVISNGKIKKGDKFKAVIVRVKKNSVRPDSSSFKFSSNSVVLLNDKFEIIGTRIFGPVPSDLRKNPMFLKILSLASEVV